MLRLGPCLIFMVVIKTKWTTPLKTHFARFERLEGIRDIHSADVRLEGIREIS